MSDVLTKDEAYRVKRARIYLADARREGFVPCGGDVSIEWPIELIDRLVAEVERLDALTLEPQCEGCGVYVAPDPTTPDGRGHQVPNEDGSPGFCGPVTSVGRAFACVRGCDAEVAVDEDGCCVTCGGDTIPVTGTPSERRVLLDIVSDLLASECNSGQDVAKDEMASLRARNEALEKVATAAASDMRGYHAGLIDLRMNEHEALVTAFDRTAISLSALNDGSGGGA